MEPLLIIKKQIPELVFQGNSSKCAQSTSSVVKKMTAQTALKMLGFFNKSKVAIERVSLKK